MFSLSLSLSLSLSHTHTHTLAHYPLIHPLPKIEDISLTYYRRDDNDIKYLDLDASMEEQVADLDLVCDKYVINSIKINQTLARPLNRCICS